LNCEGLLFECHDSAVHSYAESPLQLRASFWFPGRSEVLAHDAAPGWSQIDCRPACPWMFLSFLSLPAAVHPGVIFRLAESFLGLQIRPLTAKLFLMTSTPAYVKPAVPFLGHNRRGLVGFFSPFLVVCFSFPSSP